MPPTAIIRPLAPSDAAELAALYAANRAFLAPSSPERPERFFTEEGQRDRLQGSETRFAILAGGRIAGEAALANVARGPFQSATLGFWVAEALNGRGLATRAVAAVLEVAFGELGLHRVEAGTLVDNLRSQRVLAKNGFEEIGLARRYLRIAGEWRDHLLFQRIAGE